MVLQKQVEFFFKSRPPYQVEKKEGGCAGGWCVRRGSLLQDCLPVKFQEVKFQEMKFQDPKLKHEIFVRIDMKHSYFSNYFIIDLQSIVSVVEIIIELFVVCEFFLLYKEILKLQI